MADAEEEPTVSHYPKRKRASITNDLSESKIEIATTIPTERPERTALPGALKKPKPRNNIGDKGVVVGHWRDSQVPELENRHAVIGFIDVRDRLRTRIQHINKDRETISAEYPLPPGPGGSWVTFDRVYFSDHLVGLDQFQVKEYVRLRAAAIEDIDEERLVAEAEAVELATVRGRQLLQSENPVVAPLIAHGAIPLDSSGNPVAIDTKRRRIQSSFVPIAPQDDAALAAASSSQHPLVLDLRNGTRPTCIVLGYWRGSSEALACNCHAVCGILGQNDMFRVKVVRETRDGRYVDGNFPLGAGAIWIHYDDVEFEPHIKNLSRPEVKEYCRIRQCQIDLGETVGERRANELRAADEARVRTTAIVPTHHLQGAPRTRSSYPHLEGDGAAEEILGGRASSGHERRQPGAAFAGARSARQSLSDIEAGSTGLTTNGASSGSTPHSMQSGGTRRPLHESEEIERLNRVWARQESLRLRAGSSEDAKIYDGFKYERKPTGLFMGKLVSQGTIITIDGEDYVEYRMLTKPS